MNELPLRAAATWRSVEVRTRRSGCWSSGTDCVAEELAVAFEYNGIAHAVMMASPADLEDFALGFSLTEGIVASAAQVRDLDVVHGEQGITVRMQIAAGAFAQLKERRRTLAGRTGCGVCGTESLAQAVRFPAPVIPVATVFTAAAVGHAVAQMREQQRLSAITGTAHAAFWCDASGHIGLVREDVGRHNALDKLVGALARSDRRAEDGFFLVTSRASYEVVQKTAAAGVHLLAAVSGVTGLAVDVAQRCGVVLAGFARAGDLTVYSHPELLEQEVQR